MKKFLKIPDLHNYNGNHHLEFHKQSYEICERHAAVIAISDLLPVYRSKVAQETHGYKWIRRSEYTRKKTETDRARDTALGGIKKIVRACRKHFDPAMRHHAARINILLAGYGDLQHAGYDAGTAAIDSLLASLDSPEYLPSVQSLGVVPWVTELAGQNTLFKSYVNDTAQEQVEKPGINMVAARRETDGALRDITARVTSYAILNGEQAYLPFAGEFNVLVHHYNTLLHEHYGRLHAKTDISGACIAPLGVQPYTGKPVYVIPAVSITGKAEDGADTVAELVFSEDYTVNYRNNIYPGTATVIITGIGKYKGKMEVTFNIAG
jgi:hypothetical protein